MLNLNHVAIADAMGYVRDGLAIDELKSMIAKDESAIKDETLSQKHKEVIQESIDSKKALLAETEQSQSAHKDGYDWFMGDACAPDENGACNNPETVKIYLRLYVSAIAPSFRKYVLGNIPAIFASECYDALMDAHVNTSLSQFGFNRTSGEAALRVNDAISKLFREALSLPVDNMAIDRTVIRLNKSDLAAINRTFVTGVKATQKDDKFTGEYTYTTSITRRIGKAGTVTYNCSRFAKTISEIMLTKLDSKME